MLHKHNQTNRPNTEYCKHTCWYSIDETTNAECRKLSTDEVMQPAGSNRFGKGARCGLGREHSRAGCGLGRGHSRAGCGLGRGQAVVWEGGRLWSGKGAGCGLGRGHAVIWEGGTQWLDVGRSSFVTRLKAQTPSTLF